MTDGYKPGASVSRTESRLLGGVARIERWLLAGAAGCVFGLIAVTTVDVVARYFLNRALGWAYDTSLVLLVGLCFLSMSSVAARREHVGMELIVQKFSPPLRLGALIVASLMGGFAFGLIGWKALEYSIEAAQSGWVYGGFGKIPTWLPYGFIALGSLLLSLRLLLESIYIFRSRDRAEQSSGVQG